MPCLRHSRNCRKYGTVLLNPESKTVNTLGTPGGAFATIQTFYASFPGESVLRSDRGKLPWEYGNVVFA